MNYIDEKFKDCTPEATVKKIQEILNSVGVEVRETWTDSGVEHCHSLMLSTNYGSPSANGKGVTKALARASAYGEFIERMQCGLFFYKNQSIHRAQDMCLHQYAPDARYMTEQELIAEGDWMDYIIQGHPEQQITREKIVEHCRAFACADDGKILTLPFYSLFEKKYVYLPAAFVEKAYTSNGCCAGNTREEAWVHALSEIMERYCNLQLFTKGKAAPEIPMEQLRKYPTVAKILDQLEATCDFNITVFDYSQGIGFPVLATRVIDRKTHKYKINVSADPVMEIAIHRTLTEMFQGRRIDNLTDGHTGDILKNVEDYPIRYNVLKQLESGKGVYTADYFANELVCKEKPSEFPDNSGKTNRELLEYVLSVYQKAGWPIYIRNYSFLGFHTYKIVVPGVSETNVGYVLGDDIPEYALADDASKAFRNPLEATNDDLQWLLQYSSIKAAAPSFYGNYSRMAGPPIAWTVGAGLLATIRSYAAYRLGNYKQAMSFLKTAEKFFENDVPQAQYLSCVNKYLELKVLGIEEDKIRSVLSKFYQQECCQRLFDQIDQGKTPFDDCMISCDYVSCEQCKYFDKCSYRGIQKIIRKVGSIYQQFTDGQNPENFQL